MISWLCWTNNICTVLLSVLLWTQSIALATVDLIPYQRALNTKTLQANIVQKNSDGTSSRGILYIQRPGKVRISYIPHNTFDIVSDGKTIIQYNGLKKQSHASSLNNTPFAFLLRSFSFHNNKDVAVKKIEKQKNMTRITVCNPKKPHSGSIELQFTPISKPNTGYQLSGWTIIAAQGQKTDIALSNIRINEKIPHRYFQIARS